VQSPFFKSENSANWKSYFFEHFCTFAWPFQNSNCANVLFKVQRSAILKFALFCMFCTFVNWAITLFVALWKVQMYNCTFLLLFEKVRLCNHTFSCSLKRCDCAIALFVALWKSAITLSNVRQNVQLHNRSFKKSKCARNVQTSKLHFSCTLKRAIAHFQSVWLPNPANNYLIFMILRGCTAIYIFQTLVWYVFILRPFCFTYCNTRYVPAGPHWRNKCWMLVHCTCAKCMIALLHIFKERQNVRLHILLLFKKVRMCNRTFCHSFNIC